MPVPLLILLVPKYKYGQKCSCFCFLLCSIVFIVNCEQVVACWTWEAIVSNKLIFSIYGKDIALCELWKFVRLLICFLIHQVKWVEASNPHLSDIPSFKILPIPFVYCNFQTNQKFCSHTMDTVLKPLLLSRDSNEGRKGTVMNLNFPSVQV